MDLVTTTTQKLYGTGRYDAFPCASSNGNAVLGLWRSGATHVGDQFDTVMGLMSTDGGHAYGKAFATTLDGKPMLGASPAGVQWDAKTGRWVMLRARRENRTVDSKTMSVLLADIVTSADGVAWTLLTDQLNLGPAGWFFASSLWIDADLWVVAGYGELAGSKGWVPLTTVSVDSGKTWAPVVAPANPSGHDLSEPQVIRTRTGKWVMVARDDTTWTHHQFRSDDGVTWTYDHAIFGGASGMPSMAVTTDNTLVMLVRHMPGPDPYHGAWAWAWSDDDGATWSLRTDFPDTTHWMMYGGLAPTPDGGLACVFASEDDPTQLWKSASIWATRFDVSRLDATIEYLRVSDRTVVPYVEVRGGGRKIVSRTRPYPWLDEMVTEEVRYSSDREAGVWWDFELPQNQIATYTTGDRSTHPVRSPMLPGPLIVHPTRPELSLRVEIISDGGERDYAIDADVTRIPAAAGAVEGPQFPVVGLSGMLGAPEGTTKIRTLTLIEAKRLRRIFAGLTTVFFSTPPGSDLPEWFQIVKLSGARYTDFSTSRYASWDDDTDETQWRDWNIGWVEQERPSRLALPAHRRIREVNVPIQSVEKPFEEM